jgi:hypothetical protein
MMARLLAIGVSWTRPQSIQVGLSLSSMTSAGDLQSGGLRDRGISRWGLSFEVYFEE